MADRILGPTGGKRRRRLLLAVPFVLIATLILAIGASAGPVSDAGGFQGDDGNLVDDGPGIDWNSFAPVEWEGTAPYREAHATVSPYSFTGVEDDEESNDDTAFAGGVKQDDNCAATKGARAPNKDDLKRAYFADATVAVDDGTGGTEDHIFLALAWVRIIQNTTSPSAHVGFEFNQSETLCGGASGALGLVERTAGDLLVVYDFGGGSADTPTLTLREWVTSGSCEIQNNNPPCWGPAVNLTAGNFAEARVNTSVVGPVEDDLAPPAPPATTSTTETLGLNEFGEAIIDLTDAEVFEPGECVAFGKGFAVSRSSGNSAQAQMKDLAGPGEVDIQNCGSVIIRKETDPSPDPTDTTFDYTTTGGLDPVMFSLKDGEFRDYGDEVPSGSYSVTEADPSPDFVLADIDCSASDLSHGSTVMLDTSTRTLDFDLVALDTIDCTFVNELQRGAFIIEKRSTKTGNPLVSTAGAVFSYTNGDSGSVTDNGAGDEDPTIGRICVSDLETGTYTINETSPPDGYGDATEVDQMVTVVADTDCTSNLPGTGATAVFTNAPLYDLQVNFRDGGSGETSAEIVCSLDPPDSTMPPVDWDTTSTYTDREAPDTVTCTITVDP